MFLVQDRPVEPKPALLDNSVGQRQSGMAIWQRHELQLDLDDVGSDHPVVTVVAYTPAGRLYAMAEPIRLGRVLTLVGFHMHGEWTAANTVGTANLMLLAQELMELMDVDELLVAAGLRTTGANPGKTPRRIRLTRKPPA